MYQCFLRINRHVPEIFDQSRHQHHSGLPAKNSQDDFSIQPSSFCFFIRLFVTLHVAPFAIFSKVVVGRPQFRHTRRRLTRPASGQEWVTSKCPHPHSGHRIPFAFPSLFSASCRSSMKTYSLSVSVSLNKNESMRIIQSLFDALPIYCQSCSLSLYFCPKRHT